MRYGGIRDIVAKTGNYTVSIDRDPSGRLFTTRGAAGAVVFTLPTLSVSRRGTFYEFHNVVDQNMTITAAADKAVAVNDAAATSLAATTAGQKIGARIRAEWDGVAWLLMQQNTGIAGTVGA